MSTTIIFMIVMLIPINLILSFMPYLTRQTESFGVGIPAQASAIPELKQMRRKFVKYSITAQGLLFICFIGAAFWIHDENNISLLFSVLIFSQLAANFIVYLKFHKRMKQLKEEKPELTQPYEGHIVLNTNFRKENLVWSNLWFLVPFGITILTALLMIIYYDQIPDRMPMQYNFSGDVINTVGKTYGTVLLVPIMQFFMTGLFLFINIIIRSAKQQISAANPEKSMKQNMVFRKRWSGFLIITGTLIVLLMGMMQLSLIAELNGQFLMIAPIAITVIILFGTIYLSYTTGQGGSRVHDEGKAGEKSLQDRNEDAYWKLGIFYFNPQDPAIFIEKRFGIGWTNNWAHPISWVFIIVILGLAIGLPFLLSN